MLRSDLVAVKTGAIRELRGADDVATNFAGRAQAAQLALVDGNAGMVWAPGGDPRVVFDFTVVRGRIVAIEIMADPAMLAELTVDILGEPGAEA